MMLSFVGAAIPWSRWGMPLSFKTFVALSCKHSSTSIPSLLPAWLHTKSRLSTGYGKLRSGGRLRNFIHQSSLVMQGGLRLEFLSCDILILLHYFVIRGAASQTLIQWAILWIGPL